MRVDFDDISPLTTAHHLILLSEAGFIVLQSCIRRTANELPNVIRMTWAGYDYLDSIRRFALPEPEPEPTERKLSEFSVGETVASASNSSQHGTIIKSELYQISDHVGLLHTVKWETSGDIGSGYEDDEIRKTDKPK